ncbi:acido-empty-quinoprotein group A [Paracidobacterium acidisoli]|uniref:Acido-empty-quinoprotein group A n=1 Tax=Paracidobacterium acidisoli TaxID=2303751 RepID=A0A372IP36_9BACT|nr:acido-empty-quinoprotein group A [Paracidobacterium acidisoli]MBT9331021.1 acido-empty-quinoprotein group A [Paracidobacterium acidisoli]
MKFSKTALLLAFAAATAVLVSPHPLNAQDKTVDAPELLHPSADSWPIYHGDYSGKRHSPLTQITPQNVHRLGLAWAFQTDQGASIKSTPIVANGILYFTVPDNVWAVDVRSGHRIWHYQYHPNKGLHIGQRGVSIYRDWLYFLTPDAHLISLNAKDGSVRWDVVVADVTKGYWTTMSPMIIGNHVIVGVSGDFDNLTGFLRSVDAETGKTQWQWNATPPVGTPDSTTGGMTWMTGTYDPELNMLYWGTGNPTPVLNGKPRPGLDPYTCSIVALNPDTGKLVWSFSASPHDTHDWDAVETPVLVDRDFHGQPRKMLMQTSRNGYFYVLDRTNGKSLLSTTFGPVNWSLGLDNQGRPIPNTEKEPAPDGRLIAPDEGGLTNYRSPSFDPKTGLFVVDARPSYGIYFAKPADGTFGWAGADYGVWSKGVIEAIDYHTGKIRWKHEVGQHGSGAGVLTTDSGVTFTGDADGNILALSTADGKTLWHAGTGSPMQSSPISIEIDGRQYVITGSGGVLFAWALPDAAGESAATTRQGN